MGVASERHIAGRPAGSSGERLFLAQSNQTMTQRAPIPVIDLFAGPGGLGEGFASLDEGRKFKITVSAEMEASAHQTLTLRSFFRHTRGDRKSVV